MRLTTKQARLLGIPTGGEDVSRGKPRRQGGRTRHIAGEPNRTELEYARLFLEPRRLAGEIIDYRYEPPDWKLWLATLCTFQPDWIVDVGDGTFEVHEIKGSHMEDDAAVKIRVAARQYPDTPFYLCRKIRGRWIIRQVPNDQIPSRRLRKRGVRYPEAS